MAGKKRVTAATAMITAFNSASNTSSFGEAESFTKEINGTRIMKITTIHLSQFFGAVLGATLALNTLAQETKVTAPKPLSAERAILASVTAKVEAIDQDKREVT